MGAKTKTNIIYIYISFSFFFCLWDRNKPYEEANMIK